MSFDTERKKYAKEHLWYVEIEVDGQTYRFCENRSPLPSGLVASPTLKSVRVNPASIDLDGGIGVRAKASLTFVESMDYNIWGSLTSPVRFWSRWRAENPYYLGQRISVFSGYITENGTFDASNFTRRDYIIESFAQTGAGVSITGKDPLKLASNDRAKAPRESTGNLNADMTDTDTAFTLQPLGVGSDYPASNGIVRIGDEVILYTTRTGDSFSGLTRGYYNTEIEAHSEDDVAQLCLLYESATVDEIDYDLLVNYANVSPSYINYTDWQSEVSTAFNVTYSALITEPTGVQELLKEFSQSAPHYLYYDERVNQIQLSALKPPSQTAQLFTYQGNFIEGTTTVQDKQDMRVSTVIINYGIINPTKDLDETSNYRSAYVREDTDSVANYGQRAYKTIHSRWISSDNKTAAVLVGARFGRRFAEAPRMLGFSMDAKDADVWTGDSIRARTDLIEQSGGGYPSLVYQIISAGETANYDYTALEHTYGPAVDGDEDVEDPNTRLIYISGEQDQLSDPDTGEPRSLRDLYESVYGSGAVDSSLDVKFIFESNAVAGNSVFGEYSVRTGSWPELTTPPIIINYGYIVGRGGTGGQGSGANVIAGAGGVALYLENDIRLENQSFIGGGGGGGGRDANNRAFAAGGGGAGYTSAGGTGTFFTPKSDSLLEVQAEGGTKNAGGDGGIASGVEDDNPGVIITAEGGQGGGLGQQGVTKLVAYPGGQPGKAIELNGYTITYVQTGTILGDVS